ncbi:RNA 3'-phosphate cyclase [Methanosphaerula palustris E1-9c]|uniref:RNA 3'-terminal phosphate cyclase n=2 Tax=Methanosphaerula palustris TaxID=475088 RepID=B8GFS7_METPE|nr:RNA 3'-phosphate cyclase [Methanosphaerula palustris E1-9c]
MLAIDGASLEGGGQIIRTAVACAALTGQSIVVDHIRARRSNPGLKNQHLAAIQAVAATCEAEVQGAMMGSNQLIFRPGSPRRAEVTVDTGTAGAIPLIIQAWLPVAMLHGGSLTVTGGTEVRGAPTIDYLEHLLLRVLRHHGAEVTLDIQQRGYFPAGGGTVKVTVAPSTLDPIRISESLRRSTGICSSAAGLPGHVVERQMSAAERAMRGIPDIEIPKRLKDLRTGGCPGSSCTVWAGTHGGSMLGRPGLPAEKIGAGAVANLQEECAVGSDVDQYLADQLLVYLAVAGGQYTSSRFTLHAKTMLWLLNLFRYRIRYSGDTITEFSA